MKAISASALRKNLAKYLDDVVEKGEAIIIPRNVEEGDGRGVVISSLEDYEPRDETAYLLSTKANREHLLKSIAQAEAGNVVVYDPHSAELSQE